MLLIESSFDIVKLFLLIAIGFPLSIKLGKSLGLSTKRSILLFAWHTFFAVIYALYVFLYGGDMRMYYLAGVSGHDSFALGTDAVRFLSSVFHMFTTLPYLGMGILFSFFGLIGLMAFDSVLKQVTEYSTYRVKLLASLVVFLPSISFWSSGLGKDSLAFMSVGLVLWASMNLGRRKLFLIIGVLIMLIVRPHIAGFMVIAISFATLFDRNTRVLSKLLIGVSAVGATAIMIPLALNYAGVGEGIDPQDLANYIEQRQAYNMDGGGGIDIANMSLPMQMFTYLFRPLPFEVHSVAALMASIDNMLLLYLFIVGLSAKFKGIPAHPSLNSYFIWAYAGSTLLILSMTTSNMGIALRQKWMIVPFLVVILISYYSNKELLKQRWLESRR
ncbi:Dolichyl-phosphate-mannose-protein mannosyltransferase [uncultured Thiomicrorhabdus sp.]